MSDREALEALLGVHEMEAGGFRCSCQDHPLSVTWEAHLAGAILHAGWRLARAKTIPARSTDPATSHAATAAVSLKAGTQRARLLAAFAGEAAAFGLTDEEAADLADGVPYRSEFAKRCAELRDAGWIEWTGAKRKGVAGHDRMVSRISDAGRAALAEVVRDD